MKNIKLSWICGSSHDKIAADITGLAFLAQSGQNI